MRTIILTRGPDETRKPVVATLSRLMNNGSNHVTAHFLHLSDYDHLNEHKAAYTSIKRAFKLALNGDKHIVVDAPCNSIQCWSGFASAMQGSTFYTIGIDTTDDKIIFDPPAGFTMYQNVREHMVEEILTKHKLL